MGQGYGGSYETGGALGDIVDLTTEVIGTLPVANGGTGATTFTDNRVLTGTGTSAITAEANLLFTGTLLTALDTTQAVIGHTAAVTTGASDTFQVLGTGNADSRALVARFSADAVGPDFDFLKSRHATIASNTIVQDDDVLGRLAYYPADGTNFATLAGVFQCEVDDASPAVGDVGVAFVWRGMRGAASALVDVMRLSAGGSLSPGGNDGTALGTTALSWSDLFLAIGGVINWGNGDVTLTHSTNLLAFAGASSGYTFDALVGPATNDAAALGTATVSWADLFLAAGGVISWVNGDVTITHSTNTLAFAGASSGYTFDAVVTPAASDGAALGTATVMWSDLFLAAGAVVNFNNGDVTITHSTNLLAFAGASSGYTFDVPIGVASGGTGASTFTDNRVLTGTGTAAITDEANLTFTGQLLTATNTTDAASVQVAILQGDRATMADNDEAYLSLRLSDDAGTQTEIARIAWVADDVNFATGVDGRIDYGVVVAGTLTRKLILDGTASYPATNAGLALGTSSLGYNGLFLSTGTAINWVNGDVTITHGANVLAFAGASTGYTFDAVVGPSANDAAALGASGTAWADLFLASGGVLNFAAGDVTVTHSTNVLAFGGASSGYTFDAVVTPAASDGAALGTSTVMWSDLFLAAGAVVNFNNGDVTVTNSTNLLAFAGASSGYTFDAVVSPTTNDAAALGAATVSWADLFLASGGVINFANGNVTLTQSSAKLTSNSTINCPAAPGFSVTPIASAPAYFLTDQTFNSGKIWRFGHTGGIAGFGTFDIYNESDNLVALTFASTGVAGFLTTVQPQTSDGAALGTGSLMWSDLFLASGAVVNFNNGDVTITHAANNLAFAGSSGATLGYSFDNNVMVGVATAGATAASTLCLSNSATAPTTSTDRTHLYSADAAAGAATLALWQEEVPGIDVIVNSTHSIRVSFNGTFYKIHLSSV